MCRTSLKDVFENSFARWREKPAITFLRYGDVEKALTYGQLDRDANRLAHMFQESGGIEFQIIKAYKGELPSSVENCQAYLITGSASSVYDDEPWLEGLGRFVMDAARSVPIVGICFGHQLLHQLYGGTVEKSEKGWGIGIHDYPVHEGRSWMTPAANNISLIASHSDQVTRPAPNSRTLAGSAFCPVAMSEFGDNVMSIQPHPEMIRAFANEVFEMRRDEQGHDVTNAAMALMNNPLDDGIGEVTRNKNVLCHGAV